MFWYSECAACLICSNPDSNNLSLFRNPVFPFNGNLSYTSSWFLVCKMISWAKMAEDSLFLLDCREAHRFWGAVMSSLDIDPAKLSASPHIFPLIHSSPSFNFFSFFSFFFRGKVQSRFLSTRGLIHIRNEKKVARCLLLWDAQWMLIKTNGQLPIADVAWRCFSAERDRDREQRGIKRVKVIVQ